MKARLARPAPRGLRGREARPVLLDPLESRGDPGPKDLQGQRGRKELLARKGPKAQLAETASRVPWGSPVQLAPWAPPEKTEIRERSGSLDRRGARGTRASRVRPGPLVRRAPSDSQDPPEPTASQALAASKASLGRKVMKVQEVFLGPPGRWGCRVCRDLPERRARPGTWVRWVPQALPAPEAPLELQVLTDPKGLRVESAIPVPWERRVSPAKLESLACPEKGAPQDPKEKGVRRASPVLLVPLDPLDPKAPLGTTGPRAAPALSVFPEIPVPPESLAPRVKMAPLVTKGTMVKLDKRDLQALLANQDHLGLQGKGAPQVPQALKADRERREPRGKPAWKALLGRLAPLAPRGPPGSPGLTACEGSRALWVSKVSQAPQAPTDPRAPWVPQDSPASKEILAPKGKRVIQA